MMLAYIGPGGALTLTGSILALLAAAVLTFFGLVWYPLRRLLRWLRARGSGAGVVAGPIDPSVG